MPIQQSDLISRKQLSALSGGKVEQQRFPHNPLCLATPVSHTGGAAFATKDGPVSHIAVKEDKNLPLPERSSDNFLILRYGKAPTSDIKLLKKKLGRRP